MTADFWGAGDYALATNTENGAPWCVNLNTGR